MSEKIGDPNSEKEQDVMDAEAVHRFRDNPNVLVETGMLHMVTSSDSASDTGWIPIREKDSPDVPFELGNQRMVLIERDSDGNANIEEFRKDPTGKIAALLDAETVGTSVGD